MTARSSPLSTVSSLVSIIIPCHNRSQLLQQAIASCALQTWPDVEVLVVDDGSEENLEVVVADSRGQHHLGDRLKYIRQQRRGGGSARNLGLRLAHGDFIQFLDSDDLLHPDKLRLQVEYLRAKPQLDMVFCLDEQFQNVLGDMGLLWNVPRRSDCEDDLDRFLLEDAVWHTVSPLWRRRTLERIKTWDEHLICWQDWEFHIGALCTGIRYECVPRILSYIRHHDGPRTSWNSFSPQRRERACFQAGQLAHQHLIDAGLLDDRRRRLLFLYFLRHLTQLAWIDDDTRQLRRELVEFIGTLTADRRHRAAFRMMRGIRGRWPFRKSLGLYLRVTKPEPYKSLRNTVHTFFDSSPPNELVEMIGADTARAPQVRPPSAAGNVVQTGVPHAI